MGKLSPGAIRSWEMFERARAIVSSRGYGVEPRRCESVWFNDRLFAVVRGVARTSAGGVWLSTAEKGAQWRRSLFPQRVLVNRARRQGPKYMVL